METSLEHTHCPYHHVSIKYSPCPYCLNSTDPSKPKLRLQAYELVEVDNRYPRTFYIKMREQGIYDFKDEELEEAIQKGYVRDDRISS